MPSLCEVVAHVPDATGLFARVARDAWAVWLDSGGSDRWSILAAAPRATVVTRGAESLVATEHGTWTSRADPFSLIRSLSPSGRQDPSLPFTGGAIGFCAYDLGRRINALPLLPAHGDRIPDLAFGIYDGALLIDHLNERTLLVGASQDWQRILDTEVPPPTEFRVTRPLAAVVDRGDYETGVRKVKQYIRQGDCYQVNYTHPFRARIDGDPFSLYRKLRDVSAAPFGVYMNFPFGQILSASPERFLKVNGEAVETQPIKGTRPRNPDPAVDRQNAARLQNSAKDRAENLMIVDLLRNDLGKVCQTGSISVPHLFELKSYSNVHHLVSTVRGRLGRGRDAWDVLAACFPGGSITGAPKRRAMEIIAELEPSPRGIYCGAIGYCSDNGSMDMNIAIRTLLHRDGELEVWAGGGIVADSEPEAEYRESLDKLSAFRGILA